MILRTPLYLMLLLSTLSLFAQNNDATVLRLDLTDVVKLAKKSPDALVTETRLKNSYWQHQAFLAQYKPQISLDATLPNLNRSISAITLPDGSENFISRSFMNSSIYLSLEQDVALTGGSFFVSTGLERIDIFSSPSSSTFLSTPILLGFRQPLFSFNAMKWNKKIEPLKYKEAQRKSEEDQANISLNAAQLFFDVFISQINLEAALRDKAIADTLFEISKGRFSVGRIAETELLQIELNAMNADATLAQVTLNEQNSTEQLHAFLGMRENIQFDLIPPDSIPNYAIDQEKALEYARKNRSFVIAAERRRLEAEKSIDKANKDSRWSMNIVGSFGLSQTNKNLLDAYTQPLDQEQLTLGIQVPIADWGKGNAARQIAMSNRDLVLRDIELGMINFERDIVLKVQQLELLRNQVKLAKRGHFISQKGFDLTRKRYRIGKIGITELNLAMAEQTRSRQSYMQALKNFWLAHFDLKRLTLYDFETNQPLKK